MRNWSKEKSSRCRHQENTTASFVGDETLGGEDVLLEFCCRVSAFFDLPGQKTSPLGEA